MCDGRHVKGKVAELQSGKAAQVHEVNLATPSPVSGLPSAADESGLSRHLVTHHLPPCSMTTISERMAATGIGFAGLDGAWWLPAAAPFALPAGSRAELALAAKAIFHLLDVVSQMFDTPLGETSGLNRLLLHKTPPHLQGWRDRSPVLSLRPDFQLVNDEHAAGGVRFVATELEICPSAQGFAHAMQVGYGCSPDLADAFASLLDGRDLVFLGTQQWSEFLFEQLAFCRALAERGVTARVLYDLPISALADEVLHGRRWQPPIFGVRIKPPHWNNAVLERIHRAGLADYVVSDATGWPEWMAGKVLFRFGYLDCFSFQHLARMARWQQQGAIFLNPLSFLYDSKALMVALGLAAVREEIERSSAGALDVLDRCIPETRLLTSETVPMLIDDQPEWVIKFAGFDSGNQAWGGRSLQIGARLAAAEWEAALHRCIALPWPVVAQRITPSRRVDIDYLDAQGNTQTLLDSSTRLRVFFVRSGSAVTACGAHLTASGVTMQVSEATDAVQAPVVFRGD